MDQEYGKSRIKGISSVVKGQKDRWYGKSRWQSKSLEQLYKQEALVGISSTYDIPLHTQYK